MVLLLRDYSTKAVQKAYDSIWMKTNKGPMMQGFLPLLFLSQISSVAKTSESTPQYIEYGFDPEIFYEETRPFLNKKRSLLKEINSQFSEPEDNKFAF